MKSTKDNPIEFCLYARKSSESDERQAMSLESQINEMPTLAKRGGLLVKEIRHESHSAKASSQRLVFNQSTNPLAENLTPNGDSKGYQ